MDESTGFFREITRLMNGAAQPPEAAGPQATGRDAGGETGVRALRERQILDASLTVFSKKGFEGGRTREIAELAGVSEAIVFKYFPTKRHILAGQTDIFFRVFAEPVFLQPARCLIEEAAEPVFETARARGEIRKDVDSRTVLRLFFSLVAGQAVLPQIFPSGLGTDDEEASVAEAVAIFARGLRPEGSEAGTRASRGERHE
ncbi:MAG: TetR/AcrR family transcriptional regulator [Spirochaetes bacterium]|nr:TetR/AcrR family transcriptional regulator [Spirochaetota bacterium]